MDVKTAQAILDPSCVWNPSRDATARTALMNAGKQDPSREFGGAIFKDANGNFCYSLPVAGQGDHIAFTVPKQDGISLDAIYHTHPLYGNAQNDQFSPDDVDTANRLKLSSYIKALTNGVVKRYDPGVTPTQRMGRFDQTQKSEGTLVPRD